MTRENKHIQQCRSLVLATATVDVVIGAVVDAVAALLTTTHGLVVTPECYYY